MRKAKRINERARLRNCGWRAAVAAAVLGAVCLVLAPAQSGQAAPGQSPNKGPNGPSSKPPLPTKADFVKFRQTFGLDTSDEGMDRAQRSPASRRRVEYGVPVTQAEEDDLVHRADLQKERGSLDAVADRYADETGGVYIDQLAGGQFVALARPNLTAAHRAELQAAVPKGGTVRFDAAAASSAQMKAAMNALNDSFGRWHEGRTAAGSSVDRLWDDFKQGGVEVTGFGADPRTGALKVMAKDMDDQRAATGRGVWDRDGTSLLSTDAVGFGTGVVGAGQDNRYDSPGQLKAGVRIAFNSGNFCTANISATNGAGVHLITAGHCGGPCNHLTPFWKGGDSNPATAAEYIGNTSANAFCGTTTDADAELIQLSPGGYASPYLMGIPLGQNPQIWPIPSAQNPTESPLGNGNQICLDGVTSYWSHCGIVLATNMSVTTPEGPTLINQAYSNLDSQPGDSGAPYSWGGVVEGIHSRRALGTAFGNVSVFTPIYNVLVKYSLTPMTVYYGNPANWSTLVVRYSNMCADVQYNKFDNGTPIWQWPCDGNQAQRWSLVPNFNTDAYGNIIYSIKRFDTPWICMDVDRNWRNPDGTPKDGGKIQEWGCNGQDNQQWALYRTFDDPSQKHFQVFNAFAQKCLDLNIAGGGGGNPGANLQSWQCLGHAGYDQTNQNWRIG